MKAAASYLVCAFGLLIGASRLWALAPELQDPSVLYLDENLPTPITVALTDTITIYSEKELKNPNATLAAGQTVQVIGYIPTAFLLSGTFRGNKVEGWVDPKDIPPVDPKLINQAMMQKAHREEVAKAIKAHQVVEGMSFDEVKKSLGKPSQTSFRKDENGRVDAWTYTTYESLPQYSYELNSLGQYVQRVYYIKVPVGQLKVEFKDGSVTAFEETKTNSDSHGAPSQQ